jgi:hypothetical protein
VQLLEIASDQDRHLVWVGKIIDEKMIREGYAKKCRMPRPLGELNRASAGGRKRV